jgi:hypothetical protein
MSQSGQLFEQKEFTLATVIERTREGWRIPLVCAVAGVLLMILILPTMTPRYTVSMTVVPPPADQSQGSGGANSALSGILSLAGGSSLAQGNSYYMRYQKVLVSPAVAARMQKDYGMLQIVFQDQWDAENKQWKEPASLRIRMLGWLFRLANVPAWTHPDVMTLSSFLEGNIVVVPSTLNDIVTVSMTSSNRELAKKILLTAHTEANAVLRDMVARHASQQVAYLQNKLAGVTVADYRAALLQILSSQEKTLMLTQTDAPFAADIVSPPIASDVPSAPRPLLYVALAAAVGALIGEALVALLGQAWILRRLSRYFRFRF